MAGNLTELGYGGFAATKSIVNAYSTGGGAPAAGVANHTGKAVLSGALTANTFATPTGLSITGKGEIPVLVLYTTDTTSRTLRLRVTVDGTVIFAPTASTATTTSGAGIICAGSLIVGTSNSIAQGIPIRFSNSCVIEIASSLTETDKIAVGYILHT